MWSVFVFGWPAVITALVVFSAAIARNSRVLAILACLASAPFCFWVSGYPAIGGLGLLVLATNVAGVVALWKRQRVGAALLWAPFVLLAGLLAFYIARTQY
jgi:hypothetical protein